MSGGFLSDSPRTMIGVRKMNETLAKDLNVRVGRDGKMEHAGVNVNIRTREGDAGMAYRWEDTVYSISHF